MTNEIQAEVTKIIETLHNQIGGKAARHQYAVGKRQMAQLTELGLIEYMPAGYGHSDAAAVIAAATDAPKTVGGLVGGEGDVATTSGSDLWKLLNVPAPEAPQPEPDADEPVSDVESTVESNIIYKVMKFDNGLNYVRAQARWNTLPDLSYKAAARIAVDLIERGELELEMEIQMGRRGTGRVGDIISMYSTGKISVNDDVEISTDISYILTAMRNAVAFRDLANVLTASEAASEYGLEESTVRQALNRGSLRGRKSGETWLVLRADCEARWSDRRIEKQQLDQLRKQEEAEWIEEELNRSDDDFLPADDSLAD